MAGIAGFAEHHGKDSPPPLSLEELERRKAKIRALNIPGNEI